MRTERRARVARQVTIVVAMWMAALAPAFAQAPNADAELGQSLSEWTASPDDPAATRGVIDASVRVAELRGGPSAGASARLDAAEDLFSMQRNAEAQAQIALVLEAGEPVGLYNIMRAQRLRADIARQSGDAAQARAAVEAALTAATELMGQNHPDLGPILDWAAESYDMLGSTVLAERARTQRAGLRLRSGAPDVTAGAPFVLVPVHFATNRGVVSRTPTLVTYGAQRADLSYGLAEISIPRSHTPGTVEAPDWLAGEFRRDRNRHFTLVSTRQMSRTAFTQSLREEASEHSSSTGLLFVHGFNTTFEGALMRAAQISYDVGFQGPVITFSWPSRGSVLGYQADASLVSGPTAGLLRDTINLIARDAGVERLIVVAHSMGNQFLLRALEDMPLDSSSPEIDSIIFAAPDVEASTFRAGVTRLVQRVPNLTLYAARDDIALTLSRQVNGTHARAGDSSGGILILTGLESVDVTRASGDWLGHTPFDDKLLADLTGIVRMSLPARRRCSLAGRTGFWEVEPGGCSNASMAAAASALRQYGAQSVPRLQQQARAAQTAGDTARVGILQSAINILRAAASPN